jgi:two-component system sensor histidine kinase DesK
VADVQRRDRHPEQVGRPGTVVKYVWVAIWMWPLLGPVQQMIRGRVHPILPAAVGLAAFVCLYLICVGAGFSKDGRPATRIQLVALAAVAALGLGLAVAYLPTSSGWLALMLYVGASGASLLSRGPALRWIVGSTVALVVIGALFDEKWGDIGSSAFSMFMTCVLILVLKEVLGYIHQLRVAQAELATAAVAQERLRFSRDLHELLGHTLTLIVVKAQVVRRLAETDPVAAGAAGADIEQIGRQALVEVREAVTGYRERAFSDELDGARAALSDAGIEVSIETTGTPLPAIVDSVFGWAVREGTTNVIRHSAARHCSITVQRRGEAATLEISDDGRGPSGAGDTGNGLRGLRERLAAAGGTLASAPGSGGGFHLVASLPVGAP